MTDREKLVDLLWMSVDPYTPFGEIADFLISKGVTLQKWIPVSERLPEKEGTYLVFTESGCVTTARWYAERDMKNYRGEFIRHVMGNFHRRATHWMSLPEPPQEK